jgi:hypothetical protein
MPRFFFGYKSQADPDGLTVGESVPSRINNMVTLNAGAGNLRLSFFTARKSELCSAVRMWSGTPGSSGLDFAQIGIWQQISDMVWTQVAATANDTGLFNNASTAYTRNWMQPFQKVAGLRYAVGALQVTAAGTPAGLFGVNLGLAQENAQTPRIAGLIGGLSALPGTIDYAFTSSAQMPYAVVLP